MKTKRAVVFAVGGAVMLAATAGSAVAQAASSTRRIPISKEGPSQTVRVDTVRVIQYRTDTLRLPGRVDTVTVRLPGRVDTLRVSQQGRTDTVRMAAPLAAPVRLPTGFYLGAGGGVYAPAGALFNPNSAGPSGQVQLGWASVTQPWGLRVDGNYAKPGEDALYSQLQADPEVVNLSADLTIGLPWFTHALGLSSRFAPYLLGGGSYTMYKNLPIRLDPGVAGGNPPANVAAGSPAWSKNMGWNAGLGAGVMWGRTQIFVESRLIAFDTDNTPMARQFPTVFGINIF